MPKFEVSFFSSCRDTEIVGAKSIFLNRRLFFMQRYGLGAAAVIIGVIRSLRNTKNDGILHIACTSNAGEYGYLVWLLKRFWKGKIIIQFHGGGMRPWKAGDGNRFLFRDSDVRLVVSETIKKEYKSRTDKPLQVMLPLIPFKDGRKQKPKLRKKYGYEPEDKVILMLGSIKPLKGNLIVLRAFLALDRAFVLEHRLKLLFVGKGIESETLKQSAAESEFADRIQVIDFIPNEDVNEAYAISDLYTIASEFEGTPKSLLEAMFLTNYRSLDQMSKASMPSFLTGENGLLFERSKESELTEAIRTYVEDEQLAMAMGRGARKIYEERYSFERVVEQLVSIYEN